MNRFRKPPARVDFIPAGSLAVRDKQSDAVVYLYEHASGRPCAMGFAGRRQKPDFWVRYSTAAAREAAVRTYFASAQAIAARRQSSRIKPRKLEVGHILSASWGYDQTNVDWFQVTALIGSTMVELRPIATNNTEATGWASGKCFPVADQFTGEPIRRRAKGDAVRVDDSRYATLWDGRAQNWTAYA